MHPQPSSRTYNKLAKTLKQHSSSTRCKPVFVHQAWGLEHSPDFVCFSKKALLGGYYYTDDFQPPQGYRIFNTWMGDATKLLLFKAVLETIEKEGLQLVVRQTADQLMHILGEAAGSHPDYVSNLRGV